MKTSTDPLE
ncbi:Protein of unknown function [Propionibacterium freudenreichii]|uniref:Uncharacterized protein n=2 Tax=Propionibacterium freudenreichii TaxID=1744 RepID=D7GFK1_PROFC|nr:Hypothetical protein PFREUD_18040 [Propionibacterium freudenreichii subsp. shermanii CIRM-BIA1]CDP49039.1 Protein of unknown function [Propionibacterium freudenreichii subsp. freudenreichii]CEG86293.1 Protein of unknown function [Propionibacterium freudenreichii]CEG88020.1 Protein of unknown function [Propionibacterium freudenreichii]CEG91235.1 Protein of unknown function [Propionibacterium freudenreichii]